MAAVDILDRNQLEFLAGRREEPCISIFMPTHRAGPEIHQDPIRLKNLARQAESLVTAAGVRAVIARQILSPVRSLVRQAGFWRAQAEGLAVFASHGLFQYFRVSLRVNELVTVNDRFEVSPLIPLFTRGGRFYLLAISRNKVRFFLGDEYGVRETRLHDVPGSIDEALKYDVREAQGQFHSAEPGGLGGLEGKKGSVYHGQGVGVDDEQSRTLQFLLMVERGVRHHLRNRQLPLVLAAVDQLVAVYRGINKYPRLLETAVVSNTDGWGEDQLHTRAWDVVRPYYEQARTQAINEYKNLSARGRVSHNLKDILYAAHQGRVQTLFLDGTVHEWGRYDFEENSLDVFPQNARAGEDLFNLVAVQTILHDGSVYSLSSNEMPDTSPIAAIFRY